ncbi:hypothetical protein FJZ39_04200 [Candidatus Saccharibacteria bacterium]|nr:hypothetical protein [Candidatus Saccharibacteria bacterium]
MKIKKIITSALAGLLVVPAVALGVQAVAGNMAVASDWNLNDSVDPSYTQGDGTPTDLDGDQGIIKMVINILLFIVGIISVIMLIIGGIRYATSGGDSGSVTSAKNTILYAIIGLIVAIFAYAIINFVVDAFATS